MNIAQGLRLVKKLKGKMAELQTRATSVVSWKEGAALDYNFNDVLAELAVVRSDLIATESAIAVANATTMCGEVTLAGAIRTLQELKSEIAFFRSLNLTYGMKDEVLEEHDEETYRTRRKTVVVSYQSAMTKPQRNNRLESLQADFDALNNRVETLNHRTTLSGVAD